MGRNDPFTNDRIPKRVPVHLRDSLNTELLLISRELFSSSHDNAAASFLQSIIYFSYQ
jgi:hypothetical protein